MARMYQPGFAIYIDLELGRNIVSADDKSLDIFGTKPIAEAASHVTKAATDGAGAFLSRICLPAAEEFGLLLRDKVSAWRANNALAIAAKAEVQFNRLPGSTERHAHPRIVGAVLENGSWSDEADVQDLWAGLLVSACTASGRSQENLIYVNLLAQLTTSQARLLAFTCAEAVKFKSETGLLLAQNLTKTTDELIAVSGTSDIHALDLELDHLRHVGLLDLASGLSLHANSPAVVTPTAQALQLFVRCHGFVGSPVEFFEL